MDVADGFITYTMHFKYLGSFISYNLLDDFDINTRIDKANQSMGALKHFFNNPHVNKKSKYLIFKAIPINLLLWGCETWAIKQTHRDKLEAFLQRHLRRILKIPMSQVMEERISTDQMRERFYNIPDIKTMIAIRQLSFIGKVVRSDTPNLPTKSMITACCNHPRRFDHGQPQYHNKDTLVDNLKLLFERIEYVKINNQGSIKDWIKYAQHSDIWKELISCLKDPTKELPKRPEWDKRRRSPRDRNRGQSESTQSDPPSDSEESNNQDSIPPPRNQRRERSNRPWKDIQVGVQLYDSYKILGLELDATEIEVKVAYRALARIFHPDKIPNNKTNMNRDEATIHFQLLNNAKEHLIRVL